MLKLISYSPNSFLAVARRHALNVGLETSQALYLQQLYTTSCTNLMWISSILLTRIGIPVTYSPEP